MKVADMAVRQPSTVAAWRNGKRQGDRERKGKRASRLTACCGCGRDVGV